MTLKLNVRISELLQEIGMLSELLGENPFKKRAMLAGARIIEKLEGDLKTLLQAGHLEQQKGIGPLILSVVEDVVHNRPVAELERLRALIPKGLPKLLSLPKLGPQKVRRLWQELDIKSLGELSYAIEENRLKLLKGFGEKTQNELKNALLSLSSADKQARLDQALEAFVEAKNLLIKGEYCEKVELVGDASAFSEVVDRLELLVLRNKAAHDVDLLALLSETLPLYHHLKIVIHESLSAHSFGVTALRLRSDQAFFDAVINKASTLGYQVRNDEFIKDGHLENVPTEDRVFELINAWPQPPCQRLSAAHLLAKKVKSEPRLVKLCDLQGAFHNHTIASDGKNTLEEMRDAAIAKGLGYISINDHSQSAFYASGLKYPDLDQQKDAITLLNNDEKGKICYLFSGTESDILANGDLDFSNEALASLDVVIASVHSRLKQDHDAMTMRLINALKHPSTMILGHPTGRLLLSRQKSEFDLPKILETAHHHGVAMELNANPHRLDLSAENVAMAKEANVLIAINADAHSVRGFDDLEYGVMIAQRAGLRPSDVLNCRPLDAIQAYINYAKKKVSS